MCVCVCVLLRSEPRLARRRRFGRRAGRAGVCALYICPVPAPATRQARRRKPTTAKCARAGQLRVRALSAHGRPTGAARHVFPFEGGIALHCIALSYFDVDSPSFLFALPPLLFAMSRQAYDPGRRYAQDDRIDRRSRGGTDDVDRPLRRDERENGSSSREGGGRQRYDDRVRQRSPKGRGTREWDSSRRGRGYEDGLFNDTDGRRSGSANGSDRRRSRSPDFAHDRARERDAYDRRHGTGPEDGAQPSPQRKTAEPDFGSSGLLVQESNSKNGVTLKYFEPPEARKPRKKWRLYIFKDGKEVGEWSSCRLKKVLKRQCNFVPSVRHAPRIPSIVLPIGTGSSGCRYSSRSSERIKAACRHTVPQHHRTKRIRRRKEDHQVRLSCLRPFC